MRSSIDLSNSTDILCELILDLNAEDSVAAHAVPHETEVPVSAPSDLILSARKRRRKS